MSVKNKPTHRARLKTSASLLGPIIKALRPGLREAFDRVAKYAIVGARGYDWLDRETRKLKPKPARKRQPKTKVKSKKDVPSHRPVEPGELPRRNKKWVSAGLPNNLEHISPEDRDLARLELLRASHTGEAEFLAKRDELMKRFKIDHLPKRNHIMGAFWSHLSGHRRKKFVERVLAMASPQGKRRDKILGDLAKLYRVQPRLLTLEVDASPTIH
ncbi:hypothetical protein K8R04_02285 [Candidatus Uhrbacteria bacterium]|nr:hypothetical protein [Candidatus Uhrbacteria bacterium]